MSKLKYDCTDQEHIDWVLENQKYGGGFQHYLVEAWRRADNENRRRLEEAFPYDYRIPLGKPLENKFLCGSCGEPCVEYEYNEETDIDECLNCSHITFNEAPYGEED